MAAEALAVVGIVASIIQIVDFSSKVLHRLEEFQTSLGEIPESFRHIKAELPLLQGTLQQTGVAIDAGLVCDATKRALLPVITGCTEQIKLLDSILAKMVATPADSGPKKIPKAISSVKNDPKVERIMKTLRQYVGTLTFYHASISSTLPPLIDAKLTEIRNWLAPPGPSLNYQGALKLRQAGTGLWLLNRGAYTAWITDPVSSLWLYGIPSCGKTVLSSTILQIS
ncbi:hypothetical protein BKA65DRAFT_261707 [Rhexocercosporidium sp. MPI-PUGE-AT-0058]|nr:hypothetical protein BKA65DRAFT_261707 [Rhexocercosporidium sp. MPI-PUGE-AT-0058]